MRYQKCNFLEIDAQRGMMLPNNSVNIAICISVMEHIQDTVQAARNILQAIVPGGYLIITFDIDTNGAVVDHHPKKS